VDVVDHRKHVGMFFQKPNPFPMSIHDNIAYGPRIHGVSKKDIDGIVEAALRSAALWGETSDRLKSPCPFVERRATAEALYCQDSGSKAQNHSFR